MLLEGVEKSCAAIFCAIPGFIIVLKIPVIRKIKIVMFYMNPKFTEVTLYSFVFAMNIFWTNAARKFGMTDIKHRLVSVYYIMIV